jgi:hypothetical protein
MVKRAVVCVLMVLAATGVCFSAAPAPKHTDAGRDYDKANGFSIVPPDGWKKATPPQGIFMMYMAPEVKDGFTTNMNVNVQPPGDSLDRALPAVKKALAAALQDYKAVDEGKVTINGRPAVYLSGTFTAGGLKLQNLQYMMVGDNKKAYTITFTSLEAGFAAARPTFAKCAMTALTD